MVITSIDPSSFVLPLKDNLFAVRMSNITATAIGTWLKAKDSLQKKLADLASLRSGENQPSLDTLQRKKAALENAWKNFDDCHTTFVAKYHDLRINRDEWAVIYTQVEDEILLRRWKLLLLLLSFDRRIKT